MSADKCPECATMWMSGAHPNYDHIHAATSLPPAKRSDSLIIRRGYAVGIAGVGSGIPQTWVFFEHREPALVFGRAGRMSSHDIASYGVYEAARENRFDARRRDDVTTLYVGPDVFPPWDQGPNVGETADFLRWVDGCKPGSSQYEPKV